MSASSPRGPVIATAHLFRPLGAELVTLLRGLPEDGWARRTSAAEWSVKNVASHLLDVDLRRLSGQRDAHLPPPPLPIGSPTDLVTFLNMLNRTWVEATRRLSTRVLVDLLASSTAQCADLFESSDASAPALFPVAWAGEAASSMWLDIAREYTERWHHQDQIRDAVGAPPLAQPHWLRPVLETSLLALPHAFRGVDAPDGTSILLRIEGEAGGEWTLARRGGWTIGIGGVASPDCVITTTDIACCRLLLHRLSPRDATGAVRAEGRLEFVAPLLNARAVMV